MNKKTTRVVVGPTFGTLLFLLFLTLKLTHQIDWSWWWVTCPLWAIPAVCLLIALFALCMALIARFLP